MTNPEEALMAPVMAAARALATDFAIRFHGDMMSIDESNAYFRESPQAQQFQQYAALYGAEARAAGLREAGCWYDGDQSAREDCAARGWVHDVDRCRRCRLLAEAEQRIADLKGELEG